MRTQQGAGKAHEVGDRANAAGHHGGEAITGRRAVGQLFSGAPRRVAILQAESHGGALHEGNFLLRAVKKRETKVSAPDGQRDARHAGAGAEVQDPSAGRESGRSGRNRTIRR